MSNDPDLVIRNAGRPTPMALRVQAGVGVAQMCVGSAQIAVYLAAPEGPDMILVSLGIVFFACGLFLTQLPALDRWGLRRSWVRLEPRGIIARELGERLIPWGTITDIQPVRQGKSMVVMVHRTDGRRKRLPAPVVQAEPLDPQFVPHLNTIHQWWRAHV